MWHRNTQIQYQRHQAEVAELVYIFANYLNLDITMSDSTYISSTIGSKTQQREYYYLIRPHIFLVECQMALRTILFEKISRINQRSYSKTNDSILWSWKKSN